MFVKVRQSKGIVCSEIIDDWGWNRKKTRFLDKKLNELKNERSLGTNQLSAVWIKSTKSSRQRNCLST